MLLAHPVIGLDSHRFFVERKRLGPSMRLRLLLEKGRRVGCHCRREGLGSGPRRRSLFLLLASEHPAEHPFRHTISPWDSSAMIADAIWVGNNLAPGPAGVGFGADISPG